MADRKQTPDILTEIMGGEPAAPADVSLQPTTTPPAQKTARPKQASRSPVNNKSQDFTSWEYQIVSFQDHKGYRPRYVNGVEVNNWMDAPLIHEYLNQMAEQGWHLAAASSGQRLYGLSDTRQFYFRRPRSHK